MITTPAVVLLSAKDRGGDFREWYENVRRSECVGSSAMMRILTCHTKLGQAKSSALGFHNSLLALARVCKWCYHEGMSTWHRDAPRPKSRT